MPPWQAAAAGDAGLYKALPHRAPAGWEGRHYDRQHLAQAHQRDSGRRQQQAGWQSPAGLEQQWQGSGQQWAPPGPGPEHQQPQAAAPSIAQDAPAAAVLHQSRWQPDRRLAAAYSAGSGWQSAATRSAAGGRAGSGPAGDQVRRQGDAGAQVPAVQLGRVHSGAAPGQAGSSAAAGTGGLPLGHMANQQQWQQQGPVTSELPVGESTTGMLHGGRLGRVSQDPGPGRQASQLPLQMQMMPPPAIQQQQLAAAGAQVQAAAMSSLLLSGQAGQVTDPYNDMVDGLQLPQYQAGLLMSGPQPTQAPLPLGQGGVVQQPDLQQPAAAGLQPAWGQPGLHMLAGDPGAGSSQPGSLALSAPLEQADWSATGAGQPQVRMLKFAVPDAPYLSFTIAQASTAAAWRYPSTTRLALHVVELHARLSAGWHASACAAHCNHVLQGQILQSQMAAGTVQQSTGQQVLRDRQFVAGNAPVFSTQQAAEPPGLRQPFDQPWQAASNMQALQSIPTATSALEQLLLHGQGSVSATSQLQQQPSAPPMVI